MVIETGLLSKMSIFLEATVSSWIDCSGASWVLRPRTLLTWRPGSTRVVRDSWKETQWFDGGSDSYERRKLTTRLD